MQGEIIKLLVSQSPTYFVSNSDGQFNSRASSTFLRSVLGRHLNLCLRAERYPNNGFADLAHLKIAWNVKNISIRAVTDEHLGYSPEDEEDDDELCPVECVREFKTDEEFLKILEKSKETNTLVVVDFYRTSCGSCKYIEQGFSKLCKASGDEDVPVIFLKHNVMDEYDERSEVADRLRIKQVPLFHFYKNGTLQEAFPTRDKERITEAILKYTTPPTRDN